ncbi:hypothetical protein K469DRAFT_689889 [Zopfia rhizophila CBS 207.26]|uniref:Uncharacterized protein n=1 Tax=Zopfia rhizophila CBS 207.26 TaxID=1314779 RepID=A0A6A6DYA9_9PEZI|nr:hypothetical protein K469DRAFT_689889 [Zopfia rhizophila CBS 207.26]
MAALGGLYTNYRSSTSQSRHSYEDIQNTDMKKLTSILGSYPSLPTSPKKQAKYTDHVRNEISKLPSHLQSSTLHIHVHALKDKNGKANKGKLCNLHSQLKHDLIHSVWKWIKHELEKGIGKFLWPILMHGGLLELQEWKVRQLEPVLEMWTYYNAEYGAPLGRAPIRPGETLEGRFVPKWKKQENNCPACMLARIGSDPDVCRALLAGLVGRWSRSRTGSRDAIRSQRIRWVKYWLLNLPRGREYFKDAWDLGEELQRIRKNWKEHIRATIPHPTEDWRLRIPSPSEGLWPLSKVNRESTIGIDISEPFDPKRKTENMKRKSVEVSKHDSMTNYDISEPFDPGNTNRASSVYPRDTLGTPISTHINSQNRESVLSTTSSLGEHFSPLFPYGLQDPRTHLDVTDVVLTQSVKPKISDFVYTSRNSIHSLQTQIERAPNRVSKPVSIHSQHASVQGASDSGYETETDGRKKREPKYQSLYPAPFRGSRDGAMAAMSSYSSTTDEPLPDPPAPGVRGIYAGYGEATDDDLYSEPNTPMAGQFGWAGDDKGQGGNEGNSGEQRLADIVRRGLAPSTMMVGTEHRMTRWSDLNYG